MSFFFLHFKEFLLTEKKIALEGILFLPLDQYEKADTVSIGIITPTWHFHIKFCSKKKSCNIECWDN